MPYGTMPRPSRVRFFCKKSAAPQFQLLIFNLSFYYYSISLFEHVNISLYTLTTIIFSPSSALLLNIAAIPHSIN